MGSVAEFRREFKVLVIPLRGVSDEILESTFVNGLRPNIRAELRLLGPFMETAQKIEDRNLILRHFQEPTTHKSIRSNIVKYRPEARRIETFPTKTITVGDRSFVAKHEIPMRRLIDTKWQRKKERGLCFRCDEKFTVGYQCQNRKLRVLLVQDGDLVDEIEFDYQSEEPPLEVANKVELSLNSVVGLTILGTMKVRGSIG